MNHSKIIYIHMHFLVGTRQHFVHKINQVLSNVDRNEQWQSQIECVFYTEWYSLVKLYFCPWIIYIVSFCTLYYTELEIYDGSVFQWAFNRWYRWCQAWNMTKIQVLGIEEHWSWEACLEIENLLISHWALFNSIFFS